MKEYGNDWLLGCVKFQRIVNQQWLDVFMTQIQAEIIDNMVNVTLPPILDTSRSEALRDCLLDAIAPDMVLTLDSNQVEQLTTPGIQMLLAVAECASRKGMVFKLANPSESLIEAFRDSGLFSQLMAWDLE